jgi:hypothetical protein
LSSLQTIKDMLDQIQIFFHGEVFWQFIERMPLIFGLIVIGFISHYFPVKIENSIKNGVTNLPLAGKIILLVFVIWLAAQFKSADIQPFIYFQF